MLISSTKFKNHLLSALPDSVKSRWEKRMELVELPLGTVLHEPGASMDFVYFPEDCIISLLFILNNGSTTGLSLIGKEGLVGASIFMGDANTPNRAVIQSSGQIVSGSITICQGRISKQHRDLAFISALHSSAGHADDTNSRM